jgi:hypothetical protein
MNLCEHYACRCARANELAIMGMPLEAIEIHDDKVQCRQAPIATASPYDLSGHKDYPGE